MEPNKASVENGGARTTSSDDVSDSLYEKKWNAAFARLKAFKAKFGKLFRSLFLAWTSCILLRLYSCAAGHCR